MKITIPEELSYLLENTSSVSWNNEVKIIFGNLIVIKENDKSYIISIEEALFSNNEFIKKTVKEYIETQIWSYKTMLDNYEKEKSI